MQFVFKKQDKTQAMTKVAEQQQYHKAISLNIYHLFLYFHKKCYFLEVRKLLKWNLKKVFSSAILHVD